MSDQQVEKSVEEQVVETLEGIKEATEQKADRTELEGFVKEEALEGFVKAEAVAEQIEKAVEEAKEAQRTELEEKLQSINIITASKAKENSMEFKSGLEASNGGQFGIDLPVYKAYTDTTNVEGSSVGSNGLFYTLEQMNPFRNMATVMPVTSGSFHIPKSGAISVASRTAVNTPARTNEGSLSSENIIIETWDGRAEYSIEALDDLPGLDGIVSRQAVQAVGKAERTDAIAVLNADSDISVVDSGVAAGTDGGRPTKANVVGVMADLMTSVDIAYRSGPGSFVVSPEMEARLREANDNAYAFDPAIGMSRLFGYPVMTLAGLNDGTPDDDDALAYFGDFGSALILATRESMSVRRSDEQALGAITYYTRSRFKNAVWDADAIARLEVSA